MAKVTGTFSADGQNGLELLVRDGQSYYVVLTPSPSLTGSIVLRARDGATNQTYTTLQTYTAANTGTEYQNTTGRDQYISLRCVDLDAGPETVVYTLQSLLSTGTRRLINNSPKVGGVAGWTVNGATNLGTAALLPASQTSSTLVIPIDGLKVGDVITGFYPVGQVESAGNAAALTVNLRKLVAAAADLTNTSVASSEEVSYTADAILGRITQPVENLAVTVADGESYYFLITGTTAASTDIALQGVMVALA